jgi:hypothetical protein
MAKNSSHRSNENGGNENNSSLTKPNSTSNLNSVSLPSQWEYVLVTFHDYRGWRPRYINGHELSDWMNNPVIHEYIEKMGEDGWEIAAASSGMRMYGIGDNHQIYFKRLKTN